MYLIAQLWWYLLVAFLLGALIGYIVWRACGRGRLQSSHERTRHELSARIAALEQERTKFSTAAVESEREAARLREDLQNLRQQGGATAVKSLIKTEKPAGRD